MFRISVSIFLLGRFYGCVTRSTSCAAEFVWTEHRLEMSRYICVRVTLWSGGQQRELDFFCACAQADSLCRSQLAAFRRSGLVFSTMNKSWPRAVASVAAESIAVILTAAEAFSLPHSYDARSLIIDDQLLPSPMFFDRKWQRKIFCACVVMLGFTIVWTFTTMLVLVAQENFLAGREMGRKVPLDKDDFYNRGVQVVVGHYNGNLPSEEKKNAKNLSFGERFCNNGQCRISSRVTTRNNQWKRLSTNCGFRRKRESCEIEWRGRN